MIAVLIVYDSHYSNKSTITALPTIIIVILAIIVIPIVTIVLPTNIVDFRGFNSSIMLI